MDKRVARRCGFCANFNTTAYSAIEQPVCYKIGEMRDGMLFAIGVTEKSLKAEVCPFFLLKPQKEGK